MLVQFPLETGRKSVQFSFPSPYGIFSFYEKTHAGQVFAKYFVESASDTGVEFFYSLIPVIIIRIGVT